MPDEITLRINGDPISVRSGATVAAAMMMAGEACRSSVTGEPRGPLCGMGICFECRVVIDGIRHCRSCLVICESGMDVRTE